MKDTGRSNAVILGGTGHIGAAIARRYHAAGYEVLATGHRQIERPNLAGTDVQVVTGDDANTDTLKVWFEGASVVVDCATPYPIWMFQRSGRDTTEAALRRTDTILEAVKQAGASFTLISSFTTLPRRENLLKAMQQGALKGSHPYFDLKKRVERAVQHHLESGYTGAIIAPSTCFGPYDLKPREQAFIPMLLSGKIPALANHDLNIIDVRDVAEIAFTARNCSNQSIPLPAFGHNISLPDLARALCQIGDVSPPRFSVPTLVGTTGAYWMETAFALAGKKSPWPSLSMLLLAASYPAEPSPRQRQLHPALLSLEATLADSVAWYQKIGAL